MLLPIENTALSPLERLELEKYLRERFDHYRGLRRKVLVSWEELAAMFTSPDMDWGDIARRFGISLPSVQSLYQHFFEPLIGKSGSELRMRRSSIARDERARELPRDAFLGIVARAAEEADLVVRQVPKMHLQQELLRTKRRVLEIEGLLCEVRYLTSLRTAPKDPDFKFVATWFRDPRATPYAAHIIRIEAGDLPRRILVVPKQVIMRIPLRRGEAFAGIPMQRRPVYRNRKPRVDWWKYDDAWHLLEGE